MCLLLMGCPEDKLITIMHEAAVAFQQPLQDVPEASELKYSSVVLFYLGHLVDVVEAGQLDAQHVGWQPDGAPPPLARLDEPGPATLAAHQPHRVVKDGDPGLRTRAVRLPSQAPPPALAPPGSHAIASADPPPHWKHCTHEGERKGRRFIRLIRF